MHEDDSWIEAKKARQKMEEETEAKGLPLLPEKNRRQRRAELAMERKQVAVEKRKARRKMAKTARRRNRK